MESFAETTGIAEFGGGVDHRGTSCWPLDLPKPVSGADSCCSEGQDSDIPEGLSKENYISFKDRVRDRFRPLFQTELVALIPEWERLSNVKDNSVELHSYLVLYLTWSDARLSVFSQKQVETLKWAALLHDISKRGEP